MVKSIWVIDPAHSEIGFKVKYMMFAEEMQLTGEVQLIKQ
jgi:polyisoprenoid-binding protein YceI